MKYQTRDFGEIEVETRQMLNFRQPVFGFDDYTRYAVLHDPDAGEDVAWLQSLEEPDLCFVLVSARVLSAAYEPGLPPELDKVIGEGEHECWLIAVIHEEFQKSTINLKSPVLINWKTGFGAQVILEGDYPVRHPLVTEAEGTC
ncbi:MAG: flagellar assembly protein FliW [Clostridiales bacterium]|nr:flagellar assembly protein FliW [Clostridiales bacterium]